MSLNGTHVVSLTENIKIVNSVDTFDVKSEKPYCDFMMHFFKIRTCE